MENTIMYKVMAVFNDGQTISHTSWAYCINSEIASLTAQALRRKYSGKDDIVDFQVREVLMDTSTQPLK